MCTRSSAAKNATPVQRRDYVRFDAGTVPKVSSAPIDPSHTLPVYVTGALSVEGNEQRFTFLPGFYKTFATREHAVLCRVRPRRAFGVLRWPEEELGMWYAFFHPEDVRQIEWGSLHFLNRPMKAVAVHYESCRLSAGRFGRQDKEVCTQETLYLASDDESVLSRILADLSADEALQLSEPIPS